MDKEAEGPFGLNVVHDPPGATVDIIAVHGLGVNPKYAWTREIGDVKGKREVKWLADHHLLPAAIPTARIFTFNYESKWHEDASWHRRSLCSNQLLDALHTKRQQEEETKYRPLIFIGHSFGGIVIKQALVDANQYRGPFLYLPMSTIGIVFLGTPHRGTEAAKWGELIATSGQLLGLGSRSRILQDLRKDSLNLVDLIYPFTRWLFRFSVPIVCFFEKHKTDYGKIFGFSWKELVVGERSACIDGHRKLPLQTDHLNINKFTGPNDESYRAVLTVLQGMIIGANEKIQTRLNPRQIIEDNSIVPRKYLECLQALFYASDSASFRSIDPKGARSAIDRNKGDLVPGTCEWLLTQEKYSAWLVGKRSSVLWVLGAPGSGKTMLARYLVDELEKKVQRMPRAIMAYFFCDNKDKSRSKDTAVLRGIMLQMLRQLPSLFQHIQDDYDLQKQAMFDNFDTLWRIFLRMLEDSGGNKIYIILDALDECEPLSRSNLRTAIANLSASSPVKLRLKLLLTSRPSPDMDTDAIPPKYENQLRIDSTKIDSDLAKYIDAKLPKSWPTVTRQEVTNALVNKAGGTYLWVSLVLDDLSKGGPSLHVQQKLLELPSNLNAAFDRILDRVDREWKQNAKFALAWVVGARRPLTVGELRIALAFTFIFIKGDGLPSADDVVEMEDAVKLCVKHCGGIICHDTETDTIRLYHQCAKDYLLGKYLKHHPHLSEFSVDPEKTNLHIFEVCWRYLSSREFGYGRLIIENIDGSLHPQHTFGSGNIIYEFLDYARYEWEEHALAIQQIMLSDDKWDSFALERASTLRDQWLLKAVAAGKESIVMKLLQKGAVATIRNAFGTTALISAAKEGHEGVVRLLLEKGADIDAKDKYYGETALISAAKEGHEGVARLLVEKGADIEAESNRGGMAIVGAAEGGHEAVVRLLLEKGAGVGGTTAMVRAAKGGYEAVVRLLLEKGADVKAKKYSRETALVRAAAEGHEAVVRLLLENGASAEGTPTLVKAAAGGHEAVVRLLLEKGANVEAKHDYRGWTTLDIAAYGGHEAVVRLLLEKRADIEGKNNEYGETALIRAATGGHEAMVRLLLEKGADIEGDDRYGETSLIRAAAGGHEAVVRLLLEKGVDTEGNDRYGETPLIRAAVGGHETVVRLLLEKGANVEAKDCYGWTALIRAAEEGHEAMVRLLLETRANVEAKDSYGWTALIRAAEEGHEAMVRLLLEKGADIEAKDDRGKTAMYLAVEGGHEAVVRLLLETGVDVEAKEDYDGRMALITAAERGHEAVVRRLLEKGADIEAKDNYGWTALHGAAIKGYEAMVQLLLEKGADVEAKGHDGKTALHWAAEGGHDAMVRLLLEKGANVEAKDSYGRMALNWAAERGREAVVRLLLEKGADVEGNDRYGETSLIRASMRGYEAVVRLLLEKGADVKAKTSYGGTALHGAAMRGHGAVVRLLLEKGADVKAKTSYGGTALSGAAEGGHEAVARLLLEKGADVKAKTSDGGTALFGAAEGGHEAVARLLLEKGADIEAKDNYGWTALHGAAVRGHEAAMQQLLEKGADIEAKDDNGATALHKAAGMEHEDTEYKEVEHEDVVRLLLEKGANIEAKDNDGKTALTIAVSQGHENVVQLLKSAYSVRISNPPAQ